MMMMIIIMIMMVVVEVVVAGMILVNYHKESNKTELAVNSFLNITDAVKGQLCFKGHLYKLDPIYIPSLISTDYLQDGQSRFSSFQKKI